MLSLHSIIVRRRYVNNRMKILNQIRSKVGLVKILNFPLLSAPASTRSLSNNWMGTGESQEWGLSGRVQCVGLMSWVNTRPLICLASSVLRAKRAFLASMFYSCAETKRAWNVQVCRYRNVLLKGSFLAKRPLCVCVNSKMLGDILFFVCLSQALFLCTSLSHILFPEMPENGEFSLSFEFFPWVLSIFIEFWEEIFGIF